MTENQDERSGRERLLEISCDLFLVAGYDGVSIQQIADAVGMTKGGPYYHFRHKADLFANALIRRTERIHNEHKRVINAEPDLRSKLIAGFVYSTTHWEPGIPRLAADFERVLDPYRLEHYGPMLKESSDLAGLYSSIFREAEESGVKLTLNHERAARLFLAAMMGEIGLQGFDPVPPTEAEIPEIAVAVVDGILEGIRVS